MSDSQFGKWHKDFAKYGANSSPGRGVERLTDEQREIKRLQTELKDNELDIGKSNEAGAEVTCELCPARRF